MIRARVGFAAALVATALCADAVLAGQAVPVPQLTPVLAGRKFTAPVKGQADIEFTAPITTRVKDSIVTPRPSRNAAHRSTSSAVRTITPRWSSAPGSDMREALALAGSDRPVVSRVERCSARLSIPDDK